MEASLSACQVLIELVELEKTVGLFFDNDGAFLVRIMKLAVDCSNAFNQKYLLQVL